MLDVARLRRDLVEVVVDVGDAHVAFGNDGDQDLAHDGEDDGERAEDYSSHLAKSFEQIVVQLLVPQLELHHTDETDGGSAEELKQLSIDDVADERHCQQNE